KHNHGIRFSGVLLGLALVLEVIATLWAFYQAVQAGALYGDVLCDEGGLLEVLHTSGIIREDCNPITDLEILDTLQNTSFYEVGCDELTEGNDVFNTQCGCDNLNEYDTFSCSWAKVSYNTSEEVLDLCVASLLPFYSLANGSSEFLDYSVIGQSGCWPKNPAGTAKLTIVATSVALISQLVEAIVARTYFKDTGRGPQLMVAASAFEAAGVLTVSMVLISLPSF
ncbi:unnamed protein product, partial [Hapterophycus canaliculatus]